MNTYQKLKALNHDYHVLVEEVLQLEIGEVEKRVNVKNEFAARAADTINSMDRANKVIAPYFS